VAPLLLKLGKIKQETLLNMGQPTRKQKILKEVERHRRQRNILTLVIAVIIIAVIVTAVVFYPRGQANRVPLPDYLSHCVFGNLFYHAHPNLTITINGQGVPLPVTFSNSCPQPLHTHDSTGVIHVETDQDHDYTLGDWFKLWGNNANDPNIATFNSTTIMGNHEPAGQQLKMTVNGQPNTQYENLLLPRNAATGQNTCSVGSCAPFSIVVIYP
jgi:hypothetical protein